MLANLITRCVWSLAPPIAELSSPASSYRGNPTTLQLAIIAFGTIAAFIVLKRARQSRRERGRYEVARDALDAVSAQAPAPHFADQPAATVNQSAEHAA